MNTTCGRDNLVASARCDYRDLSTIWPIAPLHVLCDGARRFFRGSN